MAHSINVFRPIAWIAQGILLAANPDYINVEPRDILRIIESGRYLNIGRGSGVGSEAASDAMVQALSGSLLSPSDLEKTRDIFLHIGGSSNLSMDQFNEAIETIEFLANKECQISLILLSPDSMADVQVTVMTVRNTP
jgi:cell division protein FtsZ